MTGPRTHIAFPFAIGPDGRTATTGREDHIAQMIELVLFTRRGERVMRADFGAGAHELVFAENAPEVAAAAGHMVQGALQQWLSAEIELRSVEAEAIGSTLRVTVRYRPLEEAEDRVLTVEGAP